MSSHSEKPSKGKKRASWAVIGLFACFFLIVGIRSCSEEKSGSEPRPSSNQVGASKPAYQSLLGKAAKAIGAAEPKPLSAICAEFSFTQQVCELKADKDGSGWIGFPRDAPLGSSVCFIPANDPARNPFKQVSTLRSDGSIGSVDGNADSSERITAIKFIPNKDLVLTYYLAEGSCNPGQK